MDRSSDIPGPLRDGGFDVDRWRALDAAGLDEPWLALPEQLNKSSLGRPWQGLVVWHQVGPVGDLYISPGASHSILLRRSMPTELVQRQGSVTEATRWRPGEALVVPAGLPSYWRSSMPRDNIHIDLAPAWLQRAAGREVSLDSCFGREDPVLAGFAQVLLASLDSNTSMSPSFGENIALGIALHLLENYARPAGTGTAWGGAWLSARQMRRIEEAVLAALQERWSVARLAELAGLSPFHFSRAFKGSFGLSPHAWVSLQRMELAARLVRGTRRPLAEIAEASGHRSAAHFAQAFRRHWGVSPSSYRKTA